MFHTIVSPFISVVVYTTEPCCCKRYAQLSRTWYEFLDKHDIGRHTFMGIAIGHIANSPDRDLLVRMIEKDPAMLKDIWLRCPQMVRVITCAITDKGIDEMLLNHHEVAQVCLKTDAALFAGRLWGRHLTMVLFHRHLERLFFMLAATPIKPLLISIASGYESERCTEMLDIISSSTYPSSTLAVEEMLDNSLPTGRENLKRCLSIH